VEEEDILWSKESSRKVRRTVVATNNRRNEGAAEGVAEGDKAHILEGTVSIRMGVVRDDKGAVRNGSDCNRHHCCLKYKTYHDA
jgi:hypothetical protein